MTRYGLFLFYFLCIALGFLSIENPSSACSRIFYEAQDQEDEQQKLRFIGRSLDWAEDVRTAGLDLYALPQGLKRIGSTQENPFTWNSNYTSLVFYIYGGLATEGTNEKGLVASICFLKETDFGERSPSQPGLSVGLWIQYLLDSFGTVQEAVSSMKAPPFQLLLVEAGKNFKALSTIHLALGDRTGDNAIIEYIDGQPKIYHHPSFCVLTNSPPYEKQLAHLEKYVQEHPTALPGTDSSEDRFIRATYYLNALPKKTTNKEALAALFSVLDNVAKPLQKPNPSNNVFVTYWMSVLDLAKQRYYVYSKESLKQTFVNLPTLDFSTISSLSLSTQEWEGDVSNRFKPSELPPYMLEVLNPPKQQ